MIQQAIASIKDRLELFQSNKPNPAAIPSGVVALDGLMNGGFCAGKLYVVVGPPEVGKTALTISSIVHLLWKEEKKLQIGIVSTSSTPENWVERILANLCNIPLADICGGNLTSSQIQAVQEALAADNWSKLALHCPGMVAEDDIERIITRLVTETKAGIIFIDDFEKIARRNSAD